MKYPMVKCCRLASISAVPFPESGCPWHTCTARTRCRIAAALGSRRPSPAGANPVPASRPPAAPIAAPHRCGPWRRRCGPSPAPRSVPRPAPRRCSLQRRVPASFRFAGTPTGDRPCHRSGTARTTCRSLQRHHPGAGRHRRTGTEQEAAYRDHGGSSTQARSLDPSLCHRSVLSPFMSAFPRRPFLRRERKGEIDTHEDRVTPEVRDDAVVGTVPARICNLAGETATLPVGSPPKDRS